MESQLGNRAFCSGTSFSLADIAAGCCLGWFDFRFPRLDWRADRPNLARLAAKLFERPSFTETIPGD